MTDDAGTERLTTRQAADRLGVKPETVYAYVSRGLLRRHRSPSGRGSTFDAAEVDRLSQRSGRRPAATGPVAAPLATGITLIEGDRCYYRGVDSSALAARHGYEEVAQWLWTGEPAPGVRFTAPPGQIAHARAAVAALPATGTAEDRLHAATVAASAGDPLRSDLTPATVHATARALVATLVEAQPVLGPPPAAGAPLAARLWPRLTARPPSEAGLRALDAALVLLLDHDMAVSTLAARVAATARAHPYAVTLAGLGALDGPLHGAAAAPAHRMVREAVERDGAPGAADGAAAVVGARLREGSRVPGIGHLLYTGSDPRAETLFELLAAVPEAAAALDASRRIVAAAGRHRAAFGNVDLALATLSVGCGMQPEAGQVVFAVARTSGWVAHALEEYAEPAMRLRPTGHYRGPRPPRPVP
ncbi:citrate synthase [Streptomyces lonarensis]|uniref:citrate synthase (unknown stereospecificity) n=1 Tax=Streptomyces lonarensis TaxID=700599 RepID=A0A7X6HXU2_9ACTN|nr:citrate synthase [Streptomyces lonarensis]NJQ04921.1 helix-turn-helix domain-containing protein [Streptomyces lonarensis]